MNKSVYRNPMSFVKYDDTRYMVYLNERVIENYVPTNIEPGIEIEPYTAYEYTGPMTDGGTLIECTSSGRNELINGIIRSRYSQTEEDALKTHQIEILKDAVDAEKIAEYEAEWNEFNDFRTRAIAQVDGWLG